MKRIWLLVLVVAASWGQVDAADLYRVSVESEADAISLRNCAADPVLRVQGGYLVLADEDVALRLAGSGLEVRLIAKQVERNELALDTRLDDLNAKQFGLVFQEGGLRLLRVGAQGLALSGGPHGLAPLPARLPITFALARRSLVREALDSQALHALISRISQDSLQSYTNRLQAFRGRVTQTDSAAACRDWLVGKFHSFGYDSVEIDTFTVDFYGLPLHGENVMVRKLGRCNPDYEIIVGAHRDGVPESPAADDNGSGTAAVLEIARALKDMPTRLTFVFILFDAEEWGLYGAYHYAARASARRDSILYMLNMDMIAAKPNSDDANLFHGDQLTYTELWANLGNELYGMTSWFGGTSPGSDHFAFQQYGYEVTFVHEYNFSTVYHSPRDSTTYMDFDYMTKMAKVSLATVYIADSTAFTACTGFPIARNINFGPSALDSVVLDPQPEIFWQIFDTTANPQVAYEVEVGTDHDWGTAELWSSGAITSDQPKTTYAGASLAPHQLYYLRVRLDNGSGWGDWRGRTFLTHLSPVIHVPAELVSLRTAFKLALPGDTVLVADGLYTGPENRDLNFAGRNLTLLSEHGPQATILDCQGSSGEPHKAAFLMSGETRAALISGFTIRNGHAGDGGEGGAIEIAGAAPTIRDCVFENNTAGSGGAISLRSQGPLIENCRFLGNNCTMRGGAIQAYGKFASVIRECEFVNNHSDGSGGGLYNNDSTLTLERCLFAGNSAGARGGGAFLFGRTAPTLRSCTFVGNAAVTEGGAIHFNVLNAPRLEQCLIAFSTDGGAVSCLGAIQPSVQCSDIFGNAEGDWSGCIASQLDSNGNFSLDPLFCDTALPDFRLQPGSPCAPAGSSCGLLIGATEVGCETAFVCGDADQSGTVALADVVFLINYMFLPGSSAPQPPEVADVTCDDKFNLMDIIHLINYLFRQGRPPCADCP